MSGILASIAAGSMVTLSGETISDTSDIAATLTVSADGGVYGQVGVSGPVAVDTATDWLRPAAGMSNYYVRATLNSGALTSGTVDTWLQLNSDRSWGIVGLGAANLTIAIALDAAGAQIAASNTYVLSVT